MSDDENDYVDAAMDVMAKVNRVNLSNALITKIPHSFLYYNSVTIAVGKQRSGKTYSYIREIIKISENEPNAHVLIYVNRTGGESDQTFEAQKPLIKCPIIYVSHNELPDFMKEFLEYKQLYNNMIKSQYKPDQIDDNQLAKLYDVLKINDFNRPVLHTLILLDDAACTSILKSEKSYLHDLMTQCAHINCIFMLAVQFWKSLKPALKEQVSVVVLFGGFSKRDFTYIFSQIGVEKPENLYNAYQSLQRHERMIIDTVENNITIG